MAIRSFAPLGIYTLKQSISTLLSSHYTPIRSLTTIVSNVHDLRHAIAERRVTRHGGSRSRVHFVPTMGGLHQGHADLMRRASSDNTGVSVASIFVNPTQFSANEDFTVYPQGNSADDDIVSAAGIDILWRPAVGDVYPGAEFDARTGALAPTTFVQVPGGVGSNLEGQARPHFFRGVCSVVIRLLNAVQPDVLYLGQKDLQQCAVVSRMVRDLLLPIQVSIVPTAREDDGLAHSTRNKYLNNKERKVAPLLFESLSAASQSGGNVGDMVQQVLRDLTPSPCVIEYVTVVDRWTMEAVDDGTKPVPGQHALCAVINVGSTRLLDNVLL